MKENDRGLASEKAIVQFELDRDASDALAFAIEQFEIEQRQANEWISCRRVAQWLVGRGSPVPDCDLVPAYREMRADLQQGLLHKGGDDRVMLLFPQTSSPSEPWFPNIEECREFLACAADAVPVSGYFARVENDRLFAGIWFRRDLTCEYLDSRSVVKPSWLSDGDGATAGKSSAIRTSPARKRGPKPKHPEDEMRKFVFERMAYHGEFDGSDPEWSCQANLETEIGDRFGLGESQSRSYASKFHAEWQKKCSEAGN